MNDASNKNVSQLSAEQKRALLAELVRKKKLAQVKTAPLSFSQQRLWVLDQFESDNPTYNMPAIFRLKGHLNVAALDQGINEIIARHEALRTTFGENDGQPYQNIAASLSVKLDIVDLAGTMAATDNDELDRLIREETRRLFDLSKGPLIHVKLLRLDELDHVLVITFHHIVSDGWSTAVLMRELSSLYSSFINGEPSTLPDVPLQYAEYAVKQRQAFSGERQQALTQYWMEKLGGKLPALELPADRSRPTEQSFQGGRVNTPLPDDLYLPLKQLAQNEGVSLFMLLIAAFDVLLYRYTGVEDVIVGTPIANRTQSEIENLIGFFVNTLVIRTDLSGDPGFREFLGQVRRVALEAYDHQDLPFEKLVGELHPDRDIAHSPVFQVMFSMQQAARNNLEFPELKVSLQESYNGTTKFDLSLYITVSDNDMILTAEYATDLFDTETIDRFLAHYEILLQGIVESPDTAISELPLLTEAERAHMAEWNSTAMDIDRAACLHSMISAQAARSPEAVAVVAADGQLSYRELESRSNQLAHHLQSLGVGPDVLVGVCLERTTDMLVGVLGIIKAGGAYVPLDPDFPRDRLAFMLEDAQVAVLVSQTSLKADLPDSAARVVDLHQEQALLEQQPGTLPASEVGPQHLAYVIYTSGSTGKPKGVQVPHGTVVNFLSSMAMTPGCDASDTLLAVTTLSFDIAVLELYLPLTVGGTTVIASRDESSDGLLLKQRLETCGATIMQATPATWRLLLAADWQGTPGFKVLCGGEALPRDLAYELIQRVGKVWNMYGPTETTVWSTCYPISDPSSPILIGKPIANTQVYVLDARQQPVPLGVPGELYIGGDGVTRGYLNRAELTAERFIKDPFRSDPDARMYRSGDRVRWKTDGNLEYFERLDHQVKVRGYRIELGEIETVLVDHAVVQEGVVLAREDNPGDVRLVAYYVSEAGGMVTVTELRKYLRVSLPDYMIPQHFVELEQLPLTPNGKVDRKALPAPFAVNMSSEQKYIAPRTETELHIAEIWRELIGVNQVSVEDNFFELGGHSLLAMQSIARMRNHFGVRIGPMAMVMHTLEDIASECDSSSAQAADEKQSSDSLPGRVFRKIKDAILGS